MLERIIYNNYNLSDLYDETKQFLIDEYGNDPSDNEIWDEIYFQDRLTWEDEKNELTQFFGEHEFFMARGTVQRWNGRGDGGKIYSDFDTMLYDLAKDCDYIKLYDVNGHFYIQCSHHDGTNEYEVKFINEKAYNIWDIWQYNYDDKRSEREIHDIIWNCNLFSSLPHFAHNVYGAPKRSAAA